LIPIKLYGNILVHEIDKHEQKKSIVMKTFKERGLEKPFGQFWFLNHYLVWFLVLPPKDGFALLK
jgi:hypothetical protein